MSPSGHAHMLLHALATPPGLTPGFRTWRGRGRGARLAGLGALAILLGIAIAAWPRHASAQVPPGFTCGQCSGFPTLCPFVDACIERCNFAAHVRQSCYDHEIIMDQQRENQRLQYELACARNPANTWACENAKKR
jgi:hypothetical protein